MTDTIHDESNGVPPPVEYCACEVCVMARLIERQGDMIKAQDESRGIKDRRIAFLESQVAGLREEIAAHVRGEA